MESQNNEKVLVWTDDRVAKRFQAGWAKVKEEVNGVVKAYNGLNLPKLETPEDLNRLFNDTKKFLFDRMTGGRMTMSTGTGLQLEVNVGEAMNMIKEPPQVVAFRSRVDQAEHAINTAGQGHSFSWDVRAVSNDFVLSGEGVEFSERRKAKIEDAGKCYATTEKGQAIARFFAKLVQAFTDEELHKHVWFSDRKKPNGVEIASLFARVRLSYIDTETGKPVYPNVHDNEHLQWPADRNDF